MNWNDLTLFMLTGLGFLSLVITQLSEVMAKLPELIRTLHAVRHAINEERDEAGE